jgi:4'-phosphopantetheinyl transferase EntD
MVKKIINLFKKTKKKKKIKKIKKQDSAEIIDFVNKSKETNKIQTEQMEMKKMDNLAKDLVDSYFKASRKSFLDMGYCAYLLLFRLLQRMIIHLSYPIYRHYLNSTTKQIVNYHKQWLHEFKEWNEASSERKLPGEKKDDYENDTIH